MTFEDKLNAMRRDLASIVTRMNADKSYDVAQVAQVALLAVVALHDMRAGWFMDLEWKWKPEK